MSELRFSWPPIQRPVGPWVGVFLTWESKYDCWHTGVLYRGSSDTVYSLHLVGHWDFQTDKPKGNEWCIKLNVPQARLPAVTAFLRRVQKNHSRIPYGFSSAEQAWFNSVTGGLRDAVIGEGLTCITFVLALLAGAGLPLTIPETWPTREDDEVQKSEWVERFSHNRAVMGPDEGSHFDAIIETPNEVRIRLSELLGAATDVTLPSQFERARILGLQLRSEICMHFSRLPPA